MTKNTSAWERIKMGQRGLQRRHNLNFLPSPDVGDRNIKKMLRVSLHVFSFKTYTPIYHVPEMFFGSRYVYFKEIMCFVELHI